MAPHDLPLVLGQRSRFIEDVIPNANLAKVVQRASGPEEFDCASAQLEVLAEANGQLRHATRM